MERDKIKIPNRWWIRHSGGGGVSDPPFDNQYAGSIDGIDEYFAAASSTVHQIDDPSTGYTWAFWLKPTNLPGAAQQIVSTRTGGLAAGYTVFLTGSSGKLCLLYDAQYDGNGRLYFEGPVPTENAWQHWVVVMAADLSVANSAIYLNGVSQSLNSLTDTLTDGYVTNGGTFNLGTRSKPSSGGYFPGLFDQVCAFSTAFDQDDVDEIYNSGDSSFDIQTHTQWGTYGVYGYLCGDDPSDDATATTGQLTDIHSDANHLTPINTESGDFQDGDVP